jgi:hypothetical protein
MEHVLLKVLLLQQLPHVMHLRRLCWCARDAVAAGGSAARCASALLVRVRARVSQGTRFPAQTVMPCYPESLLVWGSARGRRRHCAVGSGVRQRWRGRRVRDVRAPTPNICTVFLY